MRRLAPLLVLLAFGCTSDPEPVRLHIRITNIASADVMSDAGNYQAGFSPGWLRNHIGDPLFTVGEAASTDLERLAESGDPVGFGTGVGVALPEEVGATYDTTPLLPGDTFDADLEVLPGDELSYAAMFIPSNDVFLGANIPLFDEAGEPILGDRTAELSFYDAGTEVNQAPGHGANQPAQGPGGDDENGVVAQVGLQDSSGFDYPALPSVIRFEVQLAQE